jgi:hypothetical protein
MGEGERHGRHAARHGSSNLSAMAKLDDETRRAIATGWNPHVQTMKEYARSVGFSERAVRKYRARFSVLPPEPVPAERAAVPLQAALDALQDRLGGLDVALEAARGALAVARAALAACRTVPVAGVAQAVSSGPDLVGPVPAQPCQLPDHAKEQTVPVVVQAQPAPRVRPGRRPSFFRDFE